MGEAVKSVIAQTYDDIEIIIIDNFSTDNSKNVAHTIIDQNPDADIKFIQFNNKGIIAASRNFGVKHAAGEYLAFLDSDDVWEPSKLEVQVDMLQNSRYSAIATRFKPIGEIQICCDTLSFLEKKSNISYSYEDILGKSIIVTSSILMKKDIFSKLAGFDESPDYHFIEDWELWIRLSRKYGDVLILNKKLVKYRLYSTKGRDLSDDAGRCMLIIDRQYEQGFITKDLYKQFRSSAYINYAGKCLQASKRFKRFTLVKSFFSTKETSDKFRSLVFIVLSFVPVGCVRLIRKIYNYI